MDVPRPDILKVKKRMLVLRTAAAMMSLAGISFAVSRLRPAVPEVDRAAIWIDEVKRGTMLRTARGLGALVPEDIRWIPAQTDGVVERIALQPGASVNPDSVILEMSNPQLQRDVQQAESQLKAAEADYQDLKAQIENETLNQNAAISDAQSQYHEAKIQSDLDEKMAAEGLKSDITMQQSKIHTEQLAAHLSTEEARAHNAEHSGVARLAAQLARVDQRRLDFNQRRSQLDGLQVRARIKGVLQLVSVELGQRIAIGTNLARVADPKGLKAEIKIPELQAKDVALGQKATIYVLSTTVNGRVVRIDPGVQNAAVAVDIALTDALPQGARPDLSVDGNIEIEKLDDVLYVGQPAHSRSNANTSLFMVVNDGAEAIRVRVTLGGSSANAVQIREGLKAGDKVILSDMTQWDHLDQIRLK